MYQSKGLRMLQYFWPFIVKSLLLTVLGANMGGPPRVRDLSLFQNRICGYLLNVFLHSLFAGWSGWKLLSQERGSVCTPTCWRGNVCGTLRRVFASNGLVTTSGGSCLIPTPHGFTTTMPPLSAQFGTGPRAVTSSPWPSCRLWSNTLMPPTPILEVEEGECQPTTALDAIVGSVEKEAPPPPLIRRGLKNRAAERRGTGKSWVCWCWAVGGSRTWLSQTCVWQVFNIFSSYNVCDKWFL